jgi:site-specific DNA-methyltransferase (adenine-specific)
VLDFKRDKEKYHPTQKSVPLCEWLIRTYTNENMTILDNCMGSGTTGVATINVGGNRKFIGIELDEKFSSIIEKRVINESNNSLF